MGESQINRQELLELLGFKVQTHSDRRGTKAYCLVGPNGEVYHGERSEKDTTYINAYRPVYRNADRCWEDGPSLKDLMKPLLASMVTQDQEIGRLQITVEREGDFDLYLWIDMYTKARYDIFGPGPHGSASTMEEAVALLWVDAKKQGWPVEVAL